jgi:hypothetical protein
MHRYWLTDAEVSALTRKQRPAAQRRVLDAMGYTYRLRPDGTFIVPVDQFLPTDGAQGNTEFNLDFSGLGNGTKAA